VPAYTPVAQCAANAFQTHGWVLQDPMEQDGILVQIGYCRYCNEAELVISKKIVSDATDFVAAYERARGARL